MGFGGLQTSITGLRAARNSLNTTSHNITNANNPYYVRQSTISVDRQYNNIGPAGQQGTGVRTSEVRQIRDQYLDLQLRRELPMFGYYLTKADTLSEVEEIFNEISNSGLQDTMNQFWDSWEELYANPESLTNRALVHEAAVGFTDTVNHLSDQLLKTQRNLDREIQSKGEEINYILESISDINEIIKIQEAEGSSVMSNDLRDERNALLDRLSQLLPVKTYEDEYGGTVVHLKGKSLIEGSYVGGVELKQSDDSEYGFYDIYWKGTNEKIDLGGLGELDAYIEVRNNSISKYKDMLDDLVKTVADEINKIHKKGYGLDDDKPGGRPFFEPEDNITASNIKINSDLSDYNNISVSETGLIGDGEIAKLIGEIRNKVDENFLIDPETGNPLNIDEFYNKIIIDLSLEREDAIKNAENQGFLINSIDNKRASLSSVSLDEEMTDMMKFQYAYTANSRVINTIDEMIETVVTRVGLVGR